MEGPRGVNLDLFEHRLLRAASVEIAFCALEPKRGKKF